MRVRSVPRSRDDEVLAWLARRVLGWTWGRIALEAGDSAGNVNVACRKVRDADMAEAGEPVPAEAYP